MHEDLAPKLGQMWIAAMSRIRSGIHDLGLDARGALAQHDNSAGEEHGLFHVMGDQKRGEARLLPERHEFALHGDPRQRVELAQGLVEDKKVRIVNQRPR